MKVVLLGGSFNPVHDGHKKILLKAMKSVEADEGWFVLASDPPLKDDLKVDFDVRKHFLQIMINGFTQLKVCEIERHLPVPNYTIHTIRKLKEVYPTIEFYFLIGADQAQQFDEWYQYQEILKEVKLIVFPREGYEPLKDLDVIMLNQETHAISSTEIRNNTSFKTHPQILNEIALTGIYGEERLSTHLKPSRKQHSLRVAQLSVEIAKHLGMDEKLAYGIGIAHDLLKENNEDLYLKDFEREQPQALWHAYASARYHAKRMHVKDKRFLNAIYHHTLGHSSKPYSQILFIADKCELGRNNPHAQQIIELAKKDLNKAFNLCRKLSQEYYERKKNESN